MSGKFKKHIIDNLRPPLRYNLEYEYGITYSEEEYYKSFFCEYFKLDPMFVRVKLNTFNEMVVFNYIPIVRKEDDVVIDVWGEGIDDENKYVEKMIYHETYGVNGNTNLWYEVRWYNEFGEEIYFKSVVTRDNHNNFIPPFENKENH